MQNLYNELTNSVTEYNDKGEAVTGAPTSLMLRAARAIKQLDEIAKNNAILINQYNNDINQQANEIKELNESLYQAKQQVSSVGSEGTVDQGSDSTSEEGVSPEGCSPSTS